MIIRKECFTQKYIDHQCKQIGANDRQLLEKSIHALALLGHLAESGLKFVFKGGSSLMLILSPLRRLSIDIDIVCGTPREDLNEILLRIGKHPPFTHYAEQERGFRGLPNRRHFKFFFPSQTAVGHELFILLDVVEEDELHLPTIEKTIKTDFIEVENKVMVTLPTVEALLGDKLTAFAPTTIGIPYETERGFSQHMQVVKQMFDIGELFNAVKNVREIADAYQVCYKLENRYRDDRFSQEEVLQDTIRVSYLLTARGLRGVANSEEAGWLLDGVRRLQNHLVRDNFRFNMEAKTSAAKAAFVAKLIRTGRTDRAIEAIRYNTDQAEDLKQIQLTGDLANLNTLWKTNPEAFHYWHMVNSLD
jgi:nucleotidyltransferase AbiEii toxin of type IV toxin-antitoxin system